MKLKKCPTCNNYTLKTEHCKEKTKDAHYKFVKIRNAVPAKIKESSAQSPA